MSVKGQLGANNMKSLNNIKTKLLLKSVTKITLWHWTACPVIIPGLMPNFACKKTQAFWSQLTGLDEKEAPQSNYT